MPPLNLPLTFLGRPVKPVALGLLILGFFTGLANIIGGGDGISTLGWRYFIGVQGVLAGVALCVGWLRDSQRWAEYGLLIVFWMFFTRSVFVLLDTGWREADVYQALGVAVVAGGSFFLERIDPWQRSKHSHRRGRAVT